MVTTFSVFTPEDTAPNVALKGLSLTADSLVRFRFTDPALASLGLVSAEWTFNAQEKSATPYGPYELATFDGTFAYAYVGPTLVTAGGHTITAGDNLLTGTFLNGIFSGSGSAASLNASSMGSKNVVLSSSLLHFNPAAEEGIACGRKNAGGQRHRRVVRQFCGVAGCRSRTRHVVAHADRDGRTGCRPSETSGHLSGDRGPRSGLLHRTVLTPFTDQQPRPAHVVSEAFYRSNTV